MNLLRTAVSISFALLGAALLTPALVCIAIAQWFQVDASRQR